MKYKIHQGDALTVLKTMPDESVQTCITSPPYWGLRDYGISGQLGLESTPEEFVANMVEVFREVKRVLRDDGTVWLNLGDSYNSQPAGNKTPSGFSQTRPSRKKHGVGPETVDLPKKNTNLKPKDLIGIPWRVAFALQADGWYLRSDIIWCLSGGTKVYARTQKGDMPTTLKDLYRLKPETVKLWNGNKWTQLKGMSKSPRRGDEIEIVLRSGERISCTPNHKWPTDSGLKQASELKKGDVIDRCFLPDIQNIYNEPQYIPSEIGWFVGTYLAEGSRDTSGTIQIASHKKETSRFAKLYNLAKAYHCTCRKHDTSENGMTICMDGKILNAIIDTYIAGKTAKNKHLSNACWQRNNHFLKSLLMGYLKGDGHWEEKNKRWRIGFTRNYNLESDLRTLCARLGANLTCNVSKSYIGKQKYDSFRGEIRFEHSAKGHWNQKNKGEIIEIRKARARYFYDIGVEDEPHLFALASGILTHNSKPNPMPESVTDRPTKAHEYIFLLTKKAKYYYDADAIREAVNGKTATKGSFHNHKDDLQVGQRIKEKYNNPSGRNKRTVWTVPTQPMPQAHFATFPEKLIKPCVLAGTSEKGCCPECGNPWVRVVEKTKYNPPSALKGERFVDESRGDKNRKLSGSEYNKQVQSKTTGWKPTCICNVAYPDTVLASDDLAYIPHNPVPCTVLDPFMGAATTGVVALENNRQFIGIELNKKYVKEIAEPRLRNIKHQQSLFD